MSFLSHYQMRRDKIVYNRALDSNMDMHEEKYFNVKNLLRARFKKSAQLIVNILNV